MLGTLRDHFAATVSRWPGRTALLEGERAWTWSELDRAVNRLANFLRHLGARKGDAVGLLLVNCAEFAIGFLACQKLGAVSSCLNYRLAAGPIGHAVREERLKAVIFNAELAGKLADAMQQAGSCRFLCAGAPAPGRSTFPRLRSLMLAALPSAALPSSSSSDEELEEKGEEVIWYDTPAKERSSLVMIEFFSVRVLMLMFCWPSAPPN